MTRPHEKQKRLVQEATNLITVDFVKIEIIKNDTANI